MNKENLEFAKKWNALNDEDKWKLLLNEKEKFKVVLDYDMVSVEVKDKYLSLEFNEAPGSISGIYTLLNKLGVECEYVL